MSEKRIQKVTEELDLIKKMSKDELQKYITEQTGRNSSMSFSRLMFGISSILFLISSIPLIILGNPIGFWMLGFAAMTETFKWVYHTIIKKGKKSVEDCVNELGLRLNEETNKEFEKVKEETAKLINSTSKVVRSKTSSRTTNSRSSRSVPPKTTKNTKPNGTTKTTLTKRNNYNATKKENNVTDVQTF